MPLRSPNLSHWASSPQTWLIRRYRRCKECLKRKRAFTGEVWPESWDFLLSSLKIWTYQYIVSILYYITLQKWHGETLGRAFKKKNLMCIMSVIDLYLMNACSVTVHCVFRRHTICLSSMHSSVWEPGQWMMELIHDWPLVRTCSGIRSWHKGVWNEVSRRETRRIEPAADICF